MALISLLAVYNAFPEVMDGFVYPNGIDGDILKQNLMLQTAELSILYTAPPMVKDMISAWSKKRLPIWEELYKTLFYEYNPIHNYDRTEERTEIEDRDLTANNDRTLVRNSLDTQTTHQAGYDSGSMVTSSVVDDELSAKDNDSMDTTEAEDRTTEENIRAYGNIGVTSTQDLIKQQREVVQFDIIQYIIDDFKSEFCILVY